MGGIVESLRSDIDETDHSSAIVRALGRGWRWKLMVILVSALVATHLLICLARRGLRWWYRRRRAPQPPPPPPLPPPMCTVCQDDVEQGADAVTLRCGHHYHRGCITKVVDNDPRCPVCRAPVSPAHTAA